VMYPASIRRWSERPLCAGGKAARFGRVFESRHSRCMRRVPTGDRNHRVLKGRFLAASHAKERVDHKNRHAERAMNASTVIKNAIH